MEAAIVLRDSWRFVGQDNEGAALLLLAAEIARVAVLAGVPAFCLTPWGGGGLLGPDADRRDPSGIIILRPWIVIGPDAPVWSAAGISPMDAAVLSTLPAAHPDRPHPAELRALAALRRPDLFF